MITAEHLQNKIAQIENEIRKGEAAIVQYQQALQSSVSQVTELRGAVKAYQELLGELADGTGNPSDDQITGQCGAEAGTGSAGSEEAGQA